jgi:transposase
MEKVRAKVDDKQFVRVWQLSDSVDQVAVELGLRKKSVQSVAARMRRHGVPLKPMPRNMQRAAKHYEELAELAKVANPQN